MAVLKFNIPKFQKESGDNVLRTLDFAGETLAAKALHTSLYKNKIGKALPELTDDELLRINTAADLKLNSAQYLNKAAVYPRNTILFEVDSSTTYKEGKSYIALIGANIRTGISNTIVKTALLGRRGTIKEEIMSGDWQVNISGDLMYNEYQFKEKAYARAYPAELLRLFVDLLKSSSSIVVRNNHLQMLGIERLMVESYEFNQDAKFLNKVPFSFKFVSDEVTNLYDIEEV